MLEITRLFAPVRGSEAIIELVDWHGRSAIRKSRIRKQYRDPSLDLLLRSKRAKEEAELIHLAKLQGVPTPEIFFADPIACEIIMEYVQGILVKDLVQNPRDLIQTFKIVGEYAARLHKRGIIHGDLTTKNIISSDTRLVFIDFGLSFMSDRLEDKAEDLHLLKQALKSSLDAPLAQRCFDSVREGYRQEIGDSTAKKVWKQIIKIELRGRYARVD